MASYMLFGVFSLFFSKFWYAGITNKHMILIMLDLFSKPNNNRIFTIPLNDVKNESNELLITLPNNDIPTKFRLHCGAKSFTGLDSNEFFKALKG
jgi:hypothetical protein